MQKYDPQAEGDGQYIAAFAESAGQVSPVFESKVREVFAETLGGADPDEWYELGDIVEAFETIESRTGEKTMEQAGVAAGKAIPWPDEVETVMGGFETLNEFHKQGFKNSQDEYPAGRYTFESLGDGEARVGVTSAYPYPESYPRGVFKGIVSTFTGSTGSTTPTETNPEERAAWLVEY